MCPCLKPSNPFTTRESAKETFILKGTEILIILVSPTNTCVIPAYMCYTCLPFLQLLTHVFSATANQIDRYFWPWLMFTIIIISVIIIIISVILIIVVINVKDPVLDVCTFPDVRSQASTLENRFGSSTNI